MKLTLQPLFHFCGSVITKRILNIEFNHLQLLSRNTLPKKSFIRRNNSLARSLSLDFIIKFGFLHCDQCTYQNNPSTMFFKRIIVNAHTSKP